MTLKGLYKARPKRVGMSHVAAAEFDKKTSHVLVQEVISVDVVLNPATTNTFSENTMDNEALVQELALVRTERDGFKAQIVSFESASKEHEAKVTNLVSENSRLEAELKAVQEKLAVFEEKDQAQQRRAAVLDEIKDAGLDAADFSESLMAILVDLDSDKRKTLITERTEKLKQPALGAIERKKPSGAAKVEIDPQAYLAQFGFKAKE